MKDQRDLFEIHHRGKCLAVAVRTRPPPQDFGAFYTWTALDPDMAIVPGVRPPVRFKKLGRPN